MQKTEHYDVAIVGAGVFGAWTAERLRSAGQKILLIDASGPAHARASSGGESRLTRTAYGADDIYSRMAWDSLEAWKRLSTLAGLPIFHETGVLFFFQDEHPYATATMAAHKALKLPTQLLDRTTMTQKFPQMSFSDVTLGIYEPKLGILMARRAVQTLVDRFVRDGGTYLQANIKAPQAGDSRFGAGTLPGWADFNDGALYYGCPDLEARGFKIAFDKHGPPIDPGSGDRIASAEGLANVRSYMARRFPAMAGTALVESRVCQYENSANGDLLIDRHPDWENVIIVGAGSGHGFKHGPEVGRYAAQLLLGTAGKVEPRFSLASKGDAQNRAVH